MTTTADPSTLFAQETAVFNAHKAELLKTAAGKHVVIKGDVILGVFDKASEGYAQAYRQLGNVPFLLRRVQEEEEVWVVGGSSLNWKGDGVASDQATSS